MFEKYNDPINVLANFDSSAKIVIPLSFVWHKKEYTIEKINLVHKERKGNDVIYYFSVSDNANFFRLAFFTKDLSWRLEELFYI